jgi:hypothetical protein
MFRIVLTEKDGSFIRKRKQALKKKRVRHVEWTFSFPRTQKTYAACAGPSMMIQDAMTIAPK